MMCGRDVLVVEPIESGLVTRGGSSEDGRTSPPRSEETAAHEPEHSRNSSLPVATDPNVDMIGKKNPFPREDDDVSTVLAEVNFQ